MTVSLINLGATPNSGGGDNLRVAFTKVNNNFTLIDNDVITNAANIGTGAPIFSSKVNSINLGNNLIFRSIKAGTNTSITFDSTSITINSANNVLTEITGDLDVKTFSIISTLNRDIRITPNGSGKIVLDGANWPTSFGSSGQVLTTNGAGQLSWSNTTGGVDWSFGGFNGTYSNPIEYLLDQQDINLGSFISNSFDDPIEIDLGTF